LVLQASAPSSHPTVVSASTNLSPLQKNRRHCDGNTSCRSSACCGRPQFLQPFSLLLPLAAETRRSMSPIRAPFPTDPGGTSRPARPQATSPPVSLVTAASSGLCRQTVSCRSSANQRVDDGESTNSTPSEMNPCFSWCKGRLSLLTIWLVSARPLSQPFKPSSTQSSRKSKSR
jgi:hypothetical protein